MDSLTSVLFTEDGWSIQSLQRKSLMRNLIIICLISVSLIFSKTAPSSSSTDWQSVLNNSRGQTVYWNAWGGDSRTNEFIGWIGKQAQARYGLNIKHVKLTDTAEAVSRVLSEKAAGRNSNGSIDLIWINGPNFFSMKRENLLFGPFVANLPNAKFLDLSEGSPNTVDFTEPVEGLESPWRLAKFVLIYDQARIEKPPTTMTQLSKWASQNPGRLTHPDPSNFMGATFLKQALLDLASDASILQNPVESKQQFLLATEVLWDWYDNLRPNLWRKGKSFPENESIQKQLFNDGELDFAMSFDPAVAAAGIEEGLFSKTTRVSTFENGALGNVSFVAIPYNAANKDGAMVIANLLLEPEVQARMQNIKFLGSFTVLDLQKLDPESREVFDRLPSTPALPKIDDLGQTLLEPHSSWMTFLTQEWAQRYTR